MSSDTDSRAGDAADDQSTARPATQESAQEATKRRFREALEAKQGRRGEDHVNADPHPTDHGHGPVSGKRVFRRKTG